MEKRRLIKCADISDFRIYCKHMVHGAHGAWSLHKGDFKVLRVLCLLFSPYFSKRDNFCDFLMES